MSNNTQGTIVQVPTNPSKTLKSTNQLHCCNCTKRGHDSTTCTKYRWSQHFVTPHFVTSYTKGPFYTSDVEEIIDEPPEERSDEEKKCKAAAEEVKAKKRIIIFRHKTFLTCQTDLAKKWIYLNKLDENFQYVKTDEKMIPIFVKHHFPKYSPVQLELRIYRVISDNSIQVLIRAADADSLDVFEKLLLQWLIRSDFERYVMNRVQQLPSTKNRLLTLLSTKINEFIHQTSNRAWRNLKTLKSMAQLISNLQVSMNANRNAAEAADIAREYKKRNQHMEKYKLQLIASIYNYSLIPTAKDTIDEFNYLIEQLKCLPTKKVPPTEYMAAVWFYFELFTPHLSPYIVTAGRAWEKSMMKSKKSTAERNNDDEFNLIPLLPKDLQYTADYDVSDEAHVQINNTTDNDDDELYIIVDDNDDLEHENQISQVSSTKVTAKCKRPMKKGKKSKKLTKELKLSNTKEAQKRRRHRQNRIKQLSKSANNK